MALELSGNLGARLVDSGVLLDGAGGSLRYGSLTASDAHGHRLRSWLQLRSGQLLIRVDDRHAAYPLRIDPLVQQAELTASDGAANDLFWAAVAVSPDTIAVGAPGHSVAGNVNAGAVDVFQKPASGWAHAMQSAELTVSGGAANDNLGGSVAISGDTIFAGAENRTVDGNQFRGAVYVFVKPASGWTDATQSAELVASDGRGRDGLGAAVAASGDTVVTGSDRPHRRQERPPGRGIRVRQTCLRLGEQQRVRDPHQQRRRRRGLLGESVAISGDTIALGALNHKVGANAEQGSAYVYTKPAAGWGETKGSTETTELTATDGAALDHLGFAVASPETPCSPGRLTTAQPPGRGLRVRQAVRWLEPGREPDRGADRIRRSHRTTSSARPLRHLATQSLSERPARRRRRAPIRAPRTCSPRPVTTWTNTRQTDEFTASDGATAIVRL